MGGSQADQGRRRSRIRPTVVVLGCAILGTVLGPSALHGQAVPPAQLGLPPQFEVDAAQLERSFNSPAGMVRPTERQPEKFRIRFQGSSLAGAWKVVEYPKNANFGYSVDTWNYQVRGQWDAAGNVTGTNEMSYVSILHNKGQAPYEIATRNEKHSFTGSFEASGKLRLKLRLAEAKWTFKSRPVTPHTNETWEILFDLPAKPPAEEFVALRVTTDKPAYEIGERVGVSVVLEKCRRVKDAAGAVSEQREELTDAICELKFTFPPSQVAGPIAGIRAPTADCRQFVPYAPILPGAYTIEARVFKPDRYRELIPKEGLMPGAAARDVVSASFQCTPPNAQSQTTLRARMDKIIAQYRAAIPSHRKQVWEAYVQEFKRLHEAYEKAAARALETRSSRPLPPREPRLADMAYGHANNRLFGTSWACGDYQTKVLDFLNHLHFTDPDPRLFVGVFYGPVQRGYSSNRAPSLTGEHHGVVFYPSSSKFDDDANQALDPWPRQEPAVFPLKDFRWFYSTVDYALSTPAGVYPDLGNDPPTHVFEHGSVSGYPTHGGTVFWNHGWSPAPSDSMVRGTFTENRPTPPPTAPPVSIPNVPPLRDLNTFLLQCPAHLLVTDAQGRRAGLADEKLVQEIPRCQAAAFQAAPGDYHSVVTVPPGDYTVQVQGIGQGTFQLTTSQGHGSSHTYVAATGKGRTARLQVSPTQFDAPLALPDGTQVSPITVRSGPDVAGMTPEAALAELKKLGGVLVHYDDRQPGRPVILIDCGNHQTFKDEWTRYFPAFAQLNTVSLAGTPISDAALEPFKDVQRLEMLQLTGTRITDAGLAKLRECKQLRHLDVEGTRVTAAGVADLRKARPELTIVFAGTGDAPPPPTARTTEPPAPGGPAPNTFPAAKIQTLRQRAAEACQVPEDTPEGWSKSRVDPTRLLGVFAPLRLRKGFVLRAYQFKEETNGNGFVWAMPADAEFPEPKDCPVLESHFLNAPKPSEALDDAMEAIEGDASLWSYLVASILRRELLAFGDLGHGSAWSLHTVLGDDPWKPVAPGESDDPLSRPQSTRDQWKWSEEPPKDWNPQVKIENDRVVVTFFTYSGLEKQAIYRHTDTYKAGTYRPRVEQKRIAEGPEGFRP